MYNQQQSPDRETEIGSCRPGSVSVPTTEFIRRTVLTDAVQRADTHIVMIPVLGDGAHMIDFADHPVRPGTAIHIQPGQVHRAEGGSRFSASVVLVDADACPIGLFDPADPRPVVELGPALEIVRAITADLERELASAGSSDAVALATAVLLLHQIARAGGDAPAEPTSRRQLLTAFQAELEGSFATTRSVAHYARVIGTSPKTLSRVTANLAGMLPKEMVDRRVVLEAKRLLAHSGDSSASIGTQLGFSEPTNFTKFFARHTGMSPQEFRVTH